MGGYRVFLAACQHETNSFSPIPTGRSGFEDSLWLRPSRMAGGAEAALESVVGYGALLARCREAGWTPVLGPAAFAQPSAPATAETWAWIRDAILDDLAAAGPVDAVLLSLHGAQIADGCTDCEAELLDAVRRLVGPGPIIGVLLDLHGHVGQRMVDTADVVLACLEYPHTDFDTRAEQLFDIVRTALTGGPRPFTVLARAPMIDMHHTTREPMKGLVALARGAETGSITAVSLMHGFPWGDCTEAGACVLVAATGDRQAAVATASTFARRFFELRGEVRGRHLSLDAALDKSLDAPRGPVVIADASDNPGGGAASDSTYFLHALRERGVREAGVAILWDPVAVRLAMTAGAGALLPLRIGGKAGPLSGAPFDGQARVVAVADDVRQGGPFERSGRPQGGALVEIDGLYIVLSGRRQQCVSPEAFTCFGFDPAALRLIVVKSMQHFHSHFAALATDIIYASAPGSLTFDLAALPFQRIRRPIWPLDPDLAFEGPST
jgi:microcystin degradation protein MlrC